MYDDDEPEENTTILGLGAHKAKIPFGTSLPEGVLRVGLLCGRVVLSTKAGVSVDIMVLPGWERQELIKHVDFALRNNML